MLQKRKTREVRKKKETREEKNLSSHVMGRYDCDLIFS
jgi:hypothetical protein